jgi:hypothetical protein
VSYERAMDPNDDPERRMSRMKNPAQMELKLETPRSRGWVTESNESLARALDEAARRLRQMSDEEYFAGLDRQYAEARARKEKG